MADVKEICKYEFSESENLVLSDLSRSLYRLGIIVLITGLLFVVYLVISFLDPSSLLQISDSRNMALAAADYFLWIVIALLVIYLSIMTVRLARPVKLIATTTGADITLLMDFLNKLIRMSRISFNALVVISTLLAVSLVLLVLVF